MGEPLWDPEETRGMVVDFYDRNDNIVSGNLLHMTCGVFDREPVALIKQLTGDGRGHLISVVLSRIIVPK